jgi:hypothetical protein
MIKISVTNEATSRFLSTSSSGCSIILHAKYAQARWFNCLFKIEKNRYGNKDNYGSNSRFQLLIPRLLFSIFEFGSMKNLVPRSQINNTR